MYRHMLMLLAVTTALQAGPAAAGPQKTLTAFASEQELADLFKGWAEQHRNRQEARALAAAPQAMATAGALAKSAADESVTNVQHAGVDEGGIVKLHGEHLVILRRGRLFTVAVNDKQLKPVSYADAYGDGVSPGGAWYDEMLIWGNTIAVIGYSYARGGTEIGLFEISRAGQLSYKSTYHLRSNDYYSSRNYASRLIGSKLVFYTPLYLNPWGGIPTGAFPALRKWRAGATPAEFKRIAPATRIYRAAEELDPNRGVALHSVSVCDLAQAELNCESTAVLGQPGRVFYVSPGSVYVWNVNSGVFRIPLDGSAPSMLKASGSPIDQFSFLEGDDGYLNVLLRANGRGDGMWAGEYGAGALALLRVPVASFSDGRDSAPAASYRALPKVGGYAMQNRFVGDYLLYGARSQEMYAVSYASRSGIYNLPLTHNVERIEPMGANAVAIGSNGRDLHFTSLRLARTPVAGGSYVRANAAQGETRSHGFFYKAEDAHDGVVGLPILGGNRSASLLYLRNQSLALSELGTLDSRAGSVNDHCRASCVDWYGNSRPLFLRARVFALMGYEIVEGRVAADGIRELRRISFAPTQPADEIAN
jgi:Beta propeller domain